MPTTTARAMAVTVFLTDSSLSALSTAERVADPRRGDFRAIENATREGHPLSQTQTPLTRMRCQHVDHDIQWNTDR
jgi:hypothetical protein